MAFIPATPGIVGFGGGNKPAVFQAIAPQYSLMNQQTDDDEVPKFCRDALGDSILWALSGNKTCVDCYTVQLGDLANHDVTYDLTRTDVTGTASWNGTNWVQTGIWTAQITVYVSVDGSCSGGVLESKTGDLDLTISCTGSDQMTARVAGNIPLLLGATEFIAYESINAYPFGTPMPNFRTIAFCGTATGTGGVYGAYDGTLSLSL